MKRVVTMSAFCICLLIGIPGAARATPILGGAGLTNPASTLTFDELGDLTFQPITNQFAAYGAVFGPPAQSIGASGMSIIDANRIRDPSFGSNARRQVRSESNRRQWLARRPRATHRHRASSARPVREGRLRLPRSGCACG